jgi:hypothetical protein
MKDTTKDVVVVAVVMKSEKQIKGQIKFLENWPSEEQIANCKIPQDTVDNMHRIGKAQAIWLKWVLDD